MYSETIKKYQKKYSWKAIKYPVAAQAAGEEVERIIQENNGSIEAKDIVEAARHDEAVLHKCFEWNDSIAAEKYREHSARVMLGNLVIKKMDIVGESTEPTRAFVNITIESDNSKHNKYIEVESALCSDEYRAKLLNQAKKDMESFKKKYEDLTELSNLFLEIDKFMVS